MKRKLMLGIAAASVLIAGTFAAAAANHPNRYRHHHGYGGYHSYGAAPGYGGYRYGAAPGYGGYAYAPRPHYWGGYESNRCANWYQLYRTEPPGGIIQDRSYQENVLGQSFC